MPTVLRVGPYRFHFFGGDRGERPHVHVVGPNGECKFWLAPVERFTGRNPQRIREHELRAIERLVEENHEHLLRSWHEFFGI